MAAGLSLVLLVLVAYLAPGRGLPGGCGLVAAGILWLATNKAMEGPTIIHLTHEHGLTIADLSGLTAIALGAGQVWRCVPRRFRDANR
jgi:hypothetical protein